MRRQYIGSCSDQKNVGDGVFASYFGVRYVAKRADYGFVYSCPVSMGESAEIPFVWRFAILQTFQHYDIFHEAII